MAAVQSTMPALGTLATDFCLPNVRQTEQFVSLSDFAGRPVLLMFICNHCPFVIHLVEQLSSIGNHYQRLGFGVLAISANDVQHYPQDGPEQMRVFADMYRFEFPYAYDETQGVALAYGAACTPDFFVFDSAHKLAYRGQMDVSRPSNGEPPTGDNLRSALQAVLNKQLVDPQQTPSIGCNIKWKPGNEPKLY
ncbi:MAG: peroxiredoxin [Arenicella sp.]|jgi:peroxiredoxin